MRFSKTIACQSVIGAAVLLSLSGCGGSAGGGTNGGVNPIPAPPAPPPAPTYQTIQQLGTSNAVVQTAGLGVGSNGGATKFNLGSGVTVQFNVATDTYTFNAGANRTIQVGDTSISRDDDILGLTEFRTTSGNQQDFIRLTGPKVNGVTLSYTLLAIWQRSDRVSENNNFLYLAVGGSPTLGSDIPRTGSASYSSTVRAVGSFNNQIYNLDSKLPGGQGDSSATFTANFATSTISTAITLSGGLLSSSSSQLTIGRSFGTFTGTGSIAAGSPNFSGTLSGQLGTGDFVGVFFGPQASEFGYAFTVRGSDFLGQGFVAGAKN